MRTSCSHCRGAARAAWPRCVPCLEELWPRKFSRPSLGSSLLSISGYVLSVCLSNFFFLLTCDWCTNSVGWEGTWSTVLVLKILGLDSSVSYWYLEYTDTVFNPFIPYFWQFMRSDHEVSSVCWKLKETWDQLEVKWQLKSAVSHSSYPNQQVFHDCFTLALITCRWKSLPPSIWDIFTLQIILAFYITQIKD